MNKHELACLEDLERKILWLSTWMIHHANHLRSSDDGLKVGGHQASSASLATIMTALYFRVLHPEDRVAVKPHASPIFHAIQYLFGNQTRDKLEAFRAYGGRSPILHEPRTRTMSTSRLARSASVSPRRYFVRLCRTISEQKAWPRIIRRATWLPLLAMPRWMRATFSKPCSKAGSTACAIPGGS